ncbi:Uncharacterized protein TCM_012621 [Theobroma cacao]|uniref:Uncharacterized protein n=1 Tax=Theobroma cacao TaxID=3641 RepID=A0A061FWK1_THECC|nr:Uncharacterized protein TCM_012621 [Theobroma cacao]
MAGRTPSHPFAVPSPTHYAGWGFWPPTPGVPEPPSPGCPIFWTTRLFKSTCNLQRKGGDEKTKNHSS